MRAVRHFIFQDLSVDYDLLVAVNEEQDFVTVSKLRGVNCLETVLEIDLYMTGGPGSFGVYSFVSKYNSALNRNFVRKFGHPYLTLVGDDEAAVLNGHRCYSWPLEGAISSPTASSAPTYENGKVFPWIKFKV